MLCLRGVKQLELYPVCGSSHGGMEKGGSGFAHMGDISLTTIILLILTALLQNGFNKQDNINNYLCYVGNNWMQPHPAPTPGNGGGQGVLSASLSRTASLTNCAPSFHSACSKPGVKLLAFRQAHSSSARLHLPHKNTKQPL